MTGAQNIESKRDTRIFLIDTSNAIAEINDGDFGAQTAPQAADLESNNVAADNGHLP